MAVRVVVVPLEMEIPSVACRVKDGVLYVYVDERTDPEHVTRVIEGMKAILEVTEPTTEAPPADEEGPPVDLRPPLLTTRRGQWATGGALLAATTVAAGLLLLPPQPATPQQARVPGVAPSMSGRPPVAEPTGGRSEAAAAPVELIEPVPASGRTAVVPMPGRPKVAASTVLVVSPPPRPTTTARPSCTGLLCLLQELLAP